MFIKLSAKLSFILVAIFAAIVIAGCGSGTPMSDDGITWDDADSDAPSGKTPIVAVVKTQTTRAGKTDLSYHFETDMEVEKNLVIALQIQSGDVSEGAIYVMREGHNLSEAFSFGDEITSVRVMPHASLLDFEITKMAPINTGNPSVDLSLYPMQNRKYVVSTDNGSAVR